MSKKTTIFLNYHDQLDKHQVLKKLDERLKRYQSIQVVDNDFLPIGEDKSKNRKKHIRNSDIFLALFSSKWNSKNSTFYRSVRYAIENGKENRPGEIFIIPVRLDNCEIPFEELEKIQGLDLFEIDSKEDVFDKKFRLLIRAIAYKSDNEQLINEVVTELNKSDYEGKNEEELKKLAEPANTKYIDNRGKDDTLTPDDYFVAGLYSFACDNYEEAKNRFNKALTHGMYKNAQILSKIGACDIKLEKWNDAKKQLNEAIKLDKNYPPSYFNRGILYKRQGERYLKKNNTDNAMEMFEKAISDFEYAISLLKDKTKDHRAVKTKNNLSTTKKEMYLLTEKSDFLDEAINVLESLVQGNLRANPDNFGLVRYNLACYYSLKGNLAEAYIHLKVAFEDYLNVDYSVTDIELHNFKSRCTDKYKELIRISSNDYIDRIQYNINTLIKQKNIDEINEMIDRNKKWLENIGDFNADAYHLLAYCYDSIGNNTERDDYLKKYKKQLYNEISQKTF